MRVAYALLANAAEFSSDGKLYVLGGDFDTITFPSFPTSYPSIAMALKLELSEAEVNDRHELSITLESDDGISILPPTEGEFALRGEIKRSGRAIVAGTAFNFYNIPFAREGEYTWHIFINGEEMKTILLYVSQQPGAEIESLRQ